MNTLFNAIVKNNFENLFSTIFLINYVKSNFNNSFYEKLLLNAIHILL